MPMVELTTSKGALDEAAKQRLVFELATIALEIEAAPSAEFGEVDYNRQIGDRLPSPRASALASSDSAIPRPECHPADSTLDATREVVVASRRTGGNGGCRRLGEPGTERLDLPPLPLQKRTSCKAMDEPSHPEPEPRER
jgi:hypothetical protein